MYTDTSYFGSVITILNIYKSFKKICLVWKIQYGVHKNIRSTLLQDKIKTA